MENYKNVTVEKLANIYFDGNVISRNIIFQDGTKKTLGVMLPGEYEFSTQAKELMEIISGELDLKLFNNSEWKTISGGMSFHVPKNSSFKVKVTRLTNYCCSYFEE
jgi:uncharacterized protein YaiE (UPF0345 family)